MQSTDIPLWYVPAWLGAQLPLLTIAAVVGGAAVLIGVAVRRHPSVERQDGPRPRADHAAGDRSSPRDHLQRRRALRRHPPSCSSRSPRSLPFRRSLSPSSSGNRREGGCCVPRFRSQPSSSSRRASWPRSAGRRTRTPTSTPSPAPTRTASPGSSTTGASAARKASSACGSSATSPVSVTPDGRRRGSVGSAPRPPEARLDGGALRLPPR